MSVQTTPGDAVVAANNLGLTFPTNDGDVVALSDVNLTINKGEFVSFIGPSGCGKTTFLRTIADLEQPTSGTLTINGQSPEAARRARAYGYVFQAPALYPWRTIAKNIALPLEIMGPSALPAPWIWSIWPVLSRNIPGSSRVACSSAPPLPARWRSTPICC